MDLECEGIILSVAKTKSLISLAVTVKPIFAFVFAYAKCSFSHDTAQYLYMKNNKISIFIQYESGDIFVAFICT